MYTYVVDRLECPRCGMYLKGEATVRVEGGLQSVAGDGRVTENLPSTASLGLDLRYPDIACAQCGAAIDFSYES